jgi:hypothetical protein
LRPTLEGFLPPKRHERSDLNDRSRERMRKAIARVAVGGARHAAHQRGRLRLRLVRNVLEFVQGEQLSATLRT